MVFSSMLGLKDCPEAECHQFDFAIRMSVAIAALMFLFEVAEERLRQWKVYFVSLAAVAEIHASDAGWLALPAFGGEIGLGRSFEHREVLIQICVGHSLFYTEEDCARIILHDI